MSSFPRFPLSDLCQFVSGGTPSRNVSAYFQGTIPWITGADIVANVVTEARDYITEEAVRVSATNIIPKGNILLVTRTGVGKVAINGVDICISQDFTGLLPDRTRLDVQFLFYFLRSCESYLIEQQRGATIQGITREVVAKLSVPLPPLPEQQRIAGILARADRLRRLRRYALELSEGYLQAVFVEMFYRNAQPNWPVSRVADLAKQGANAIRTGPFGSQLLHSEFVSEGIAVLGIDNAVNNRFTWGRPRFITEQKYRLLKRYTVLPGDVIITIMGTTGRCAVVPDSIPTAINTKHLCCISLDQQRCLPIFLQRCFLAHPHVQQQLGLSEKGAIMPGLNMEIIKELRFPLPPMELQRQFASIADRYERLRTQQREAARQAEQLFGALLDRAFRGEL